VIGCEGRIFHTPEALGKHKDEQSNRHFPSIQDKDEEIKHLQLTRNVLVAFIRALINNLGLQFDSPGHDDSLSNLANLEQWLEYQWTQELRAGGRFISAVNLLLQSIMRVTHSPSSLQLNCTMTEDFFNRMLGMCTVFNLPPQLPGNSGIIQPPSLSYKSSGSALADFSMSRIIERKKKGIAGEIRSDLDPGTSKNLSNDTCPDKSHKKNGETETEAIPAISLRPKGKKKHQCIQCWKHFTRSTTLKEHMRTHNDDRPFKCRSCGRGFARSKDNKRHETLHVGERKFVCKASLHKEEAGQELFWGCGRRFTREDALKAHLLTEIGWKCMIALLDDEESWRSFTRFHEDPDILDEEKVFCKRRRRNGDVIGCDFRCRSRERLFEHFRSLEGRKCFRPVLVEVALDDCRLLRDTQGAQKSTDDCGGSIIPQAGMDDVEEVWTDKHENTRASANPTYISPESILFTRLGGAQPSKTVDSHFYFPSQPTRISSGEALWIYTTRPPLFWEPISGHPLPVKLASMKAALAAGADPNELDHEPRPERNRGRPLHLATDHLYTTLSHLPPGENLPVVELLLEHGADPRLKGLQFMNSPLERLRQIVRYNNPGAGKAIDFFRRALDIMEVRGRELDGLFPYLEKGEGDDS
jgi:hypothetical protein